MCLFLCRIDYPLPTVLLHGTTGTHLDHWPKPTSKVPNNSTQKIMKPSNPLDFYLETSEEKGNILEKRSVVLPIEYEDIPLARSLAVMGIH